MFSNLWKRTKKVASMYTGTFIVVLILNQLLFFGFCLNPICLVAAMPHVLLITVVIGSWFNKTANWGKDEIVAASSKLTTSGQDKPTLSEAPIAAKIENALNTVNAGMEKVSENLNAFNEKLDVHLNTLMAAKRKFSNEKSFVECYLNISKAKQETQQELDNDPKFREMYDKVVANWDQGKDEKVSVEEPEPEVREVANFILPAHYENAENIEEIKEKVAKIVAEHSKFLKETKHKLDHDPDLMAIFEEEMEKSGGSKILAHIVALQPSDSVFVTHNSTGPHNNTSSSKKSGLLKKSSRRPVEKPHKNMRTTMPKGFQTYQRPFKLAGTSLPSKRLPIETRHPAAKLPERFKKLKYPLKPMQPQLKSKDTAGLSGPMGHKLTGNWRGGYACDIHTLKSRLIGVDEYGNNIYDNTRSEMGQLVYQLKYSKDFSTIQKIIKLVSDHVTIDGFDYIIPVPASKKRISQPVDAIAQALGDQCGIPVIMKFLGKAGSIELKSMDDPMQRVNALRESIKVVGQEDISDKNVLLIDDLYRSGATLNACCHALREDANVGEIWVLTMTKTRTKT